MSTPSKRTSTGWALTGATGSSTARDYFEKDYEYAVELIKKGLAYVCDLTPEQCERVPRRHRQARHLPVPRPRLSRRTSTSSSA